MGESSIGILKMDRTNGTENDGAGGIALYLPQSAQDTSKCHTEEQGRMLKPRPQDVTIAPCYCAYAKCLRGQRL